jgi:hypothetical protein
MTATQHHPNRRAFPRWKAKFDVRYGKAGSMRTASGFEIGEDGIAFAAPERFTPAMEIDLAYRFNDGADWTEVKAVVCHCDGDSTGVEFLNLRRADRLRILEYINANCGEAN